MAKHYSFVKGVAKDKDVNKFMHPPLRTGNPKGLAYANELVELGTYSEDLVGKLLEDGIILHERAKVLASVKAARAAQDGELTVKAAFAICNANAEEFRQFNADNPELGLAAVHMFAKGHVGSLDVDAMSDCDNVEAKLQTASFNEHRRKNEHAIV